MLEEYTDTFKDIYDAVPHDKIFRICFDAATKCFRVITRDRSAFEYLQNAFAVKNDAAFFTERYGYKAAPFLY